MTTISPSLAERAAALTARLTSGPPRVNLVQEPTPLHPAPALSDHLGVEILFKRDDLTGLGFGGNKLRALEYLIADALVQGCDSVLTGAGPQSNWTMLAALSAIRHGLQPHIISYGAPAPSTGNLLLHKRLGVRVTFTGSPEKASVDDRIVTTAAGLRSSGRNPYVIPRGGATALGSLGYLRASLELSRQFTESDIRPSTIWLATGSCGTQAGLVAGRSLLQSSFSVTGVTVSRPEAECRQRISDLAVGAARLVGVDAAPVPIIVDGWIGTGYGIPSPAGDAAIDLVARTEGIFLDPVFGGKAMAALIAVCRSGAVTGPVVFLVSGGGPTLFADGGTV